ncbi:MAG: hypothetical protein ABSF77_19110 [Spirochaetia bacterium]|jgi:hypothetical protein
MSAIDVSLLLNGIERRAASGTTSAPLRFVLCAGEVLRLPRHSLTIRVLSGTAWITHAGRDIVLDNGGVLPMEDAGDCPLISSVGTEALLFETR